MLPGATIRRGEEDEKRGHLRGDPGLRCRVLPAAALAHCRLQQRHGNGLAYMDAAADEHAARVSELDAGPQRNEQDLSNVDTGSYRNEDANANTNRDAYANAHLDGHAHGARHAGHAAGVRYAHAAKL